MVSTALLVLSLPPHFGAELPSAVRNIFTTGDFDLTALICEAVAVQCCHMWTIIVAKRLEAVLIDPMTMGGSKRQLPTVAVTIAMLP
ncbi:hypothetical protein B0T09DRAFT_343195 [Sordaria sp. MPI-SDFR-AT-0083]|nr:hypothetical protein B0T09DRAFT_343195 [Sordaria sp. MPI-SDFR-AT-0083]